MSVVDMCAVFQKTEFKQIIEEYAETLEDKSYIKYINESLNQLEYNESVDYTQVLNIRRKRINRYKNDTMSNSLNGFNPFKNNNFKPIPRMENSMNTVVAIRKFEEIKLQPQHYDFLKTRGISEQTADDMKLFPAEKYFQRLNKKTDAIGFPYFKNGKFISAKYRSIESKDFTQDTGGSQDFFGIDNVDPTKPVVIVEGEIDALTLM
jgi:hypothetical protein